MEYNWFKIFNTTEFDALNLVSKTYSYFLDGVGQKDILVTKGENYGITYGDVFLSLELNDENPFRFDSHAIYVDANNNVYLGLPIAT